MLDIILKLLWFKIAKKWALIQNLLLKKRDCKLNYNLMIILRYFYNKGIFEIKKILKKLILRIPFYKNILILLSSYIFFFNLF